MIWSTGDNVYSCEDNRTNWKTVQSGLILGGAVKHNC